MLALGRLRQEDRSQARLQSKTRRKKEKETRVTPLMRKGKKNQFYGQKCYET